MTRMAIMTVAEPTPTTDSEDFSEVSYWDQSSPI